MLRSASCLLALVAGLAAAAPCDAPPEVVIDRECRAELAALERRLTEMLGSLTELHPDVRALKRSIEEKRECAEPAAGARTEAAAGTEAKGTEAKGTEAKGTEATQGTEAPPRLEAPVRTEAAAEIAIDAGSPRQALMGFGATWPWSVFETDRITDSQWRRAIGHLVADIGARTGEAPPVVEPQGREPGPGRTIEGFSRPLDFTATEKLFGVYARHAPGGIDDVFPFAAINVRWAHPWLRATRAEDFTRYLDEVAAKALAVVADWKARTGREPEFLQLWNEPISGNGELGGGTHAEMVQTLRHAGRRLREAGHERVRFVVPAEETVRDSLAAMRAIAADGEALATVGAIAYHVYPYGSEYAYIPRLLATRAQGREFDGPTRERLELRRMSDSLRLPTWMTEVSHGYERGGGRRETSVPDSIDWIVGRAVHIHDELKFAGASAFFGMMAIWSDVQERDPTPGAGARFLRSEGDSLVLVDTGRDEVIVSGIGHAIGHYGRWLRRGARYLDATSSNPRLLVSPFRDGDKLVAVLVNLARAPLRASLRLAGGEMSGAAELEQSRTGACRDKLAPIEARDGVLALEVAPWSVTTLAVPMR